MPRRKWRACRRTKAAVSIAEQYCNGTRISRVRTGVRNGDVRVAVVIQIGYRDPTRVRTGRDRDLAEFLSARENPVSNQKQREMGRQAHDGFASELNPTSRI